ncbi:unnamed protein product, partial [Symbiodinium sp. KB8]
MHSPAPFALLFLAALGAALFTEANAFDWDTATDLPSCNCTSTDHVVWQHLDIALPLGSNNTVACAAGCSLQLINVTIRLHRPQSSDLHQDVWLTFDVDGALTLNATLIRVPTVRLFAQHIAIASDSGISTDHLAPFDTTPAGVGQ